MRVDAGVPRSPRQVLILTIGYVKTRTRVAILLCETIINKEHFVTLLENAHQEIVWLDVSMNEVFVVKELDTADHLVCQHEYSFHGKATRTEVEQILQAGSQEVHNEDVVVLLLPEISENIDHSLTLVVT